MSSQPSQGNSALFRIFISYAHGDDDNKNPSKMWLDRLILYLAPLTRRGLVSAWSDKKIEGGDSWLEEIKEALHSARAAVLMVGPAFMASTFIREEEVPVLLRKADAEGLVILSVILRECGIDDEFLYPNPESGPGRKVLTDFQLMNPPGRPLNGMTEAEQDAVFLAVARRLKQLAADARPAPPAQPAPPDEHARAVEGALDQLPDLTQASEGAQAAVRRYRSDFEAARTKIMLLSAYKALHDLLHTLHFQCFDPVGAELSQFPDDAGSADRLDMPEQHLGQTLDAVRDEAADWNQFGIETTYLIEDLEFAHGELRGALADSDRRRLRRSHTRLGRVLNIYPFKINTLLLGAARELPLPGLVGAMSEVGLRLHALRTPEAPAREFREGVASLGALDERLRELLYEHDQWQKADGEMRPLDINAEEFEDELLSLWPRLKVITEVLYRENQERWAQRFAGESENMEAALAEPGHRRVKSAFRRYRREAGLRFFDVDVKLLELCDSLKAIGEALDRVLPMLAPATWGGGNGEDDAQH